MDGGAQKLLESSVLRTLHAQNFSRSSVSASLVLTDLLSRYLVLLTSTCARYAEHSGRTRINVKDAVVALEELGVSIEELEEFGRIEGGELGRYALVRSQRRVEDLREFRAHLSDGLKADDDDVIPLQYTLVPPNLLEEAESEEEDADADADSEMESMSPARKRQRTLDWDPPEHIPSFLPPFPTGTTEEPPERVEPPEPSILAPLASLSQPPIPERTEILPPPNNTLVPASTSAAASDYLVQVPYSQSSISGVSEWHLPSYSTMASDTLLGSRFPTPLTEPSLLSAYHHILTHPPPPAAPMHLANPARHKVAMALLSLMEKTSRWQVQDTLYGTLVVGQPRVSSVGPSYPLPVDGTSGTKEFKFPTTAPRSVASTERISPMVSQQGSRIPDLARLVLNPAIHSRTTRLTHPPALSRNNKVLTYGAGIPAPWNANTLPTENPKDNQPNGILKPDANTNGLKSKEPAPALPDARLFATWDHEHKDFKTPLVAVKLQRTRIGTSSRM
ncbi:hypothetical protein BDP27DRAFT_1219607 [Rhodocollybia butyracea]|uniref:Bromodomain associated domain-containing protein n=1 Tax=Rhodocollybia butyracea TaxID=206335 RepID=A0A9P5U9I9_9AGAR|nr:hypothetical protein BDP27DRAFT_1219607 [Rhodocollybia butyracea]